MHCLFIKMISIVLVINAAICAGVIIPDNFSGSPEVFSGFLPDKDKYVEAFSYREDCNVVEGTAALVSDGLAQLNPKGKYSIISKRNVYYVKRSMHLTPVNLPATSHPKYPLIFCTNSRRFQKHTKTSNFVFKRKTRVSNMLSYNSRSDIYRPPVSSSK